MQGIELWSMIIGVSLVSLLPRILPIAWFSRFEFPPLIKKWLSFVAPAVLGALTALSILAPNGEIEICASNIYIWAFLPTFLTALKTKNLFYTLLVGILIMAVLYNLTN